MSRPHSTLILPDIHAPWQNQALLNRIYKIGPVDQVVLLGDALDLFSLSKYNDGSLSRLRGINLSYEYKQGAKVVRDVEAAFPRASKTYLYGNHELRFDRWLESGDNSKTGTELGRPEQALRLREHGWKVLTNPRDDSVRVGDHLELAHGDDCPKHAAAKYLEEYQGSVVFGHTHRFQSYVLGKRGAWNIGLLGEPSADGFQYLPLVKRQKWVNAFAVAYTLDCGNFLMTPVQCYNSRFIFNGRLY